MSDTRPWHASVGQGTQAKLEQQDLHRPKDDLLCHQQSADVPRALFVQRAVRRGAPQRTGASRAVIAARAKRRAAQPVSPSLTVRTVNA